MRKLAVILVAAAIPALANADVNSDAKAFAKGINARLEQSTKQTDPSIVPNYQGTNVEGTQYYDSGFNIENQAHDKAANDPTAQFMYEGNRTRPSFQLDRNTDPLFRNEAEIYGKAGGLLDTYSDCESLPVGEGANESAYRTCTVKGERRPEKFVCSNKLVTSCSGTPRVNASNVNVTANKGAAHRVITRPYGIDLLSPGGDNYCGVHVTRVAFDAGDRTGDERFRIKVTNIPWQGAVALNGVQIFAGSYLFSGITSIDSLNQATLNQYCLNLPLKKDPGANIDITNRVSPGLNIIDIYSYAGGYGNLTEVILEDTRSCIESSSSEVSCPTGKSLDGATLESQVCTQGPETRNINGHLVYKDCWAWSDTYSKPGEPVFIKDASCAAIEAQGCGQVGSSCDSFNGSYCVSQTITYQCQANSSERSLMLCGSSLVCPDGECTADVGRTYDPATDDFKEAASRLSVAQEIADQIDMDTFTIFKGKPLECQNKTLGMSNCCKDSGWLHDIGLGSCDAEEKELGLAKEAKKTVYVGSYDRGSFLDKRTYKAYCSYPSKLGRIIIQQARPQLGLGFGSPSNPVCDGLTLEQFEQVDFNRIDLSEFYSDAMDKADSSVNPLELVEALKERMQSLYGGASQ